jgi:cytoskeletal protein RodZ
MSDFQRGALDDDEERLPWLEPVDDYEDEEGISIARLIAAVVVGLVALGLVIGGIFWLRNRGQSGDGTLIAAPAGPIKEKPPEAGGMNVEGAGDVAYDASVGKDVNSTIDLTALPEAPVADNSGIRPAPLPPSTSPQPSTPAPAVKPAPVPAAKSAPAAPQKQASAVSTPLPATATPEKPVKMAAANPAPAPKPLLPAPVASSSGGGSIQLGAFSSQALANKAWSSLSGRFGFLSGMEHSVVSATIGGKTLYRLRASAGSQASSTCAKLKVAGEACSVVD